MDSPQVNPDSGFCATIVGWKNPPGGGIPNPVYGCTLRAAIQVANHAPGPDTIMLPAGTYALEMVGDEENTGKFNDLDVTDELTILGEDRETTIIDAQNVAGAALSYARHAFQLTHRAMSGGSRLEIDGVTIRQSASNGIDVDGVFLLVASDVTIRDNEGHGVRANGGASFSDCDIFGNTGRGIWYAGPAGGDLSVERCEIEGNEAGIVNSGASTRLVVIDSTISGNGPGGGISDTGAGVSIEGTTISGNTGAGGLSLNRGTSSVVTASTISDNRSGHSGGGVDLSSNLGVLTLINSTVSGNRADGAGGGIASFGTTKLQSSTVTDNASDADGNGDGDGGGVAITGIHGEVHARNSIIRGNSAGSAGASGNDCDGDFTSETHNLVGPECSDFRAEWRDLREPAGLHALADYGGTTLTHLPGAATAAVDAGALGGCWADHDGDDETPDVLLEVDQRGYGRMADGNHDGFVRCDIGAVERLPEPSALAGSLAALAGTAWLARRRRR